MKDSWKFLRLNGGVYYLSSVWTTWVCRSVALFAGGQGHLRKECTNIYGSLSDDDLADDSLGDSVTLLGDDDVHWTIWTLL
jgi:hypothetical protein